MKRLVIGLAAVAALSFAANSMAVADQRYKAPPRWHCAQFNGWYGGLNVGLAGLDSSWNDRDNWIDNFAFDFNTSHLRTTRSGLSAGVHGGYNHQSGCTVFGVEADWTWASVASTKSMTPAGVPATTLTVSDKLNWFSTVRARTGVVVDSLLFYVTGGLAIADIRHDWTVTDPIIPATETFSAKRFRWGGVVGIGTEWAWTPQWSLKSEVLYMRFQELTTSGFSAAGGQIVNFDSNDSVWVSRVGVTYRFGGPLLSRF